MIELVAPTLAALAEYGSIPISFEVREVMDVRADETGFRLTPRSVAEPYVKDYDEGTNEGPTAWPLRFDLSPWILVLARSAGQAIGGAAVACRTPTLTQLEGRADLAVCQFPPYSAPHVAGHRGPGVSTRLGATCFRPKGGQAFSPDRGPPATSLAGLHHAAYCSSF